MADERKGTEDTARLWFGLLDKLVQAQRTLANPTRPLSLSAGAPTPFKTPVKPTAAPSADFGA